MISNFRSGTSLAGHKDPMMINMFHTMMIPLFFTKALLQIALLRYRFRKEENGCVISQLILHKILDPINYQVLKGQTSLL